MFFKAGVSRLLPPAAQVHCGEYVPRTGALAYLVDRCARCNAREEQHHRRDTPQPQRRSNNGGPLSLKYWLIRDIASDAGWSLRSRLQVMMDACAALLCLHQAGLCYGPTLRATAVMCSAMGRGALRRALVQSKRMDAFDAAHLERCSEDMHWFGKLLALVCANGTHENDSLKCLTEQLLDAGENRPDAETALGWLEGIIQDLNQPFDVPKFASSRHPFYGFIELVTEESVQDRTSLLAAVAASGSASATDSSSKDTGYESDDSFHPLAKDGEDEEESGVSGGEDSDTASQSSTSSTQSKLGSFLSATVNSVKRRVSVDKPPSATPAAVPHKRREFRPLSSATRNNFRLSYSKTHLRVQVPTPKQVAEIFDRQDRISPEEASALLAQAEAVMRRERNVLEICDRERVQVFGDIHGQYFDLRHALALSNYSLEDEGEDRTLLFMGDYVDRGAWSCEVLFLLLALKLARPSRVFLLRGNHECGAVVSFFGFKEEMECKYGQTLFNKSLLTFQAMPLCAIVSTATNKRWLVCHGGISPKLGDVYADVGAINRFAEPGMNGLFCDLLWADPQMEIDEFANNPNRGCSVRFGKAALHKFLEENFLAGLIRGHEVMEDGVLFDDRVCTVFSAPNYCGRYGNRGAFVYIHPDVDELEAVRYDSAKNQPDPRTFDSVVLETNARITETLPFMPTTLGGFVNRALELYSATADKVMLAQDESLLAKMQVLMTSRNFEDSVEEEEEDEDTAWLEEQQQQPLKQQQDEDAATCSPMSLPASAKQEEEEESFLLDSPSTAAAAVAEDVGASAAKQSSFNLAKTRLSNALSKQFQTAKYSDGINEAHPSLTQFKIQSAELLLRMRFRKAPSSATTNEESSPAAAAKSSLSSPTSTSLRRVSSADRIAGDATTTSTASDRIANNANVLNMSVDSVYISTPPQKSPLRKRASSLRKRNAAELFTPLGMPVSEVYPAIQVISTPRSPITTPTAASTETKSSPFAGSSSFSETELRDLQLLFMLVDRSDDAKITFEEIMQWSQDEGEMVREEDAKKVIEAVDADRDGVIGLDDWLWFAHCCREVYNAERLEAMDHDIC